MNIMIIFRKLVERAQSFSPERPVVKPKPLPPPRRRSPPPPKRESPPPSRPASPSPSIPPPAPPIPADGPPSIPNTPLILPKKFKPKMSKFTLNPFISLNQIFNIKYFLSESIFIF